MPSTESTAGPGPICASCKEPTTKCCSGCKGAPGVERDCIEATWYCSSECQKLDWNSRKSACKAHEARKLLYRAGSAVQVAFELYREELFDKSIRDVKRKGKDVVLVDNYYPTGDCIFPFPSSLVSNENEKRAILIFMTCEDAAACMHNMIKRLLRGTCSNFLEVVTISKNRSLNLTCLFPNGVVEKNDKGHEVVKATLMNGEEYSVDITGAQYGHYEPVVPWKEYLNTRAASVARIDAFGTACHTVKGWCASKAWMGKIMRLHWFATIAMDQALENWAQDNDLTLAAMLKLPEAQYLSKRAEMLATIKAALQKFKAENKGLVCPKRDTEGLDELLAMVADMRLL